MPFDPSLGEEYVPSLEEILKDININSPTQFKEAILEKGRELYNKSEIKQIKGEDFILCDSSDFYKTLVNLGHGSAAMTVFDDSSPEKYFLIFKDKIPKNFYEIVAAHESCEYRQVKGGIGQPDAHLLATIEEIETAKRLGKDKDYFTFLKEKYPLKFEEMKNI